MINFVAYTRFVLLNYVWSYWLDTSEMAAFCYEVTQPEHDIQQYNSHCSVEPIRDYFVSFTIEEMPFRTK